MLTATTEPTLDAALASHSPAAQRMFAAYDHLVMVIGYDWPSGRYIAEQRQHIEQAIAELQAAQAELDPPVAATD
jgi:hypothetical protein